MGLVHSPLIVTDGLFLALDAKNVKSYPSSGGSTWYNLTKDGINGTISGATHNSSGYFSFNGSSNYIATGAASDWAFLHNGASDFTIEAWVYFSFSANYAICATGGSSAETGMYFGQLSTSNYLNYQIFKGQSGAIANFGSSTNGMDKGKWNYAVFTFDSSSKTGTYYVNGVSSGSTSNSSYGYSSSNSNYPLQIGRYVFNNGSSTGGYYNGRHSVVNIYKDKALSASEITQNFNAHRWRFGIWLQIYLYLVL